MKTQAIDGWKGFPLTAVAGIGEQPVPLAPLPYRSSLRSCRAGPPRRSSLHDPSLALSAGYPCPAGCAWGRLEGPGAA